MSAPALAATAEELEASRQKKRRRKKHREQEETTAASSEAPRPPTTPESKRQSTVPVGPETLTSAAAAAAGESPRPPANPESKSESPVPVAPETLTSAGMAAAAVRLVKERERKNQVAPRVRKEEKRRKKRKHGEAAVVIPSPPTPAAAQNLQMESKVTAEGAAVRKKQRRRKVQHELSGQPPFPIDVHPLAGEEAAGGGGVMGSQCVKRSSTISAPAEELEPSPRPPPQTKQRVTISSLPPIAVSPPADTLEVAVAGAFWGVEVKPGEPYIHRPSPGRRFRITQALLGSYADVGWSILECNVGSMNPVRICALNPTNHICDLEIEYEERESVFLSVSGSSSIHLSGRIYNHSASDDQAHTSNKLASKTESPACLKRKHPGNEANGNKEPSLKEPNVTKADGKNDASSKEPLISEAGGKNVTSPKQPIVGEDDYSDDHLPIRVAHKKRMATRKRKYRTPGIGKALSGQNNDYKIMEYSAVQTVPTQDHEITQEDIVTKADGKNEASLEEPIISEASGKNAASPKQPIVGEDDYSDDHLPIRVAYERMATRNRRKYKSPGMRKILSDNNNDHKIMDSNVMHIMPTQDHEVTQGNISQFVGATGQSTRDDGFLFTGATNQHNWVSVEEFYKGDGKSTASNGSKVTVEYVGKLLDGQIVDPMAIRKFKLGAGEVIPGWDAGISGMRVGSKRKVTIPPALGHGNRAVGMIPANSWLVYEFELKKVRRTKKASQVSKNPS